MIRVKPTRRGTGVRSEGDVTDAGAWLALYNGAIAAKKDHREAAAAADRGFVAFRMRFPTAGQKARHEAATQAAIEAKIAEAEKGKK